MKRSLSFAPAGAALLAISFQAGAASPPTWEDLSSAEAMFRTVANQCGSPTFRRAFTQQSKARVKSSYAAIYQKAPDLLERDVARQVDLVILGKENCEQFLGRVKEEYEHRSATMAGQRPPGNGSGN